MPPFQAVSDILHTFASEQLLMTNVSWRSRTVISWIHGIWETGVFNLDQECQFTSSEFMTELRTHGILISMDGRGQCLDHTKMERFWWALK